MRKRLAVVPLLEAFLLAGIACAATQVPIETNTAGDPLVSTFSIVALDPATGDLGIAVQSKFPNVRAVVPWTRAGVGAVATQSFAKLSFGSDGLDLLARGATAEEALEILLRADPLREQRQVGIVDARGHAATWTGKECFAWAGGRVGQDGAATRAVGPGAGVGTVVAGHGFTIQGNILVSEATVEAMARAYESTPGELADRLMAALVAGGKAGGDQRGEQSAALLVTRKGAGYDGSDNFIDISVYDHLTPIAELERLYALNRLYFTRSRPENMIPVTADDRARDPDHLDEARLRQGACRRRGRCALPEAAGRLHGLGELRHPGRERAENRSREGREVDDRSRGPGRHPRGLPHRPLEAEPASLGWR